MAVGIEQAGGFEYCFAVLEVATQRIFERALQVVNRALLVEFEVGEGRGVIADRAASRSGKILSEWSRFGMTSTLVWGCGLYECSDASDRSLPSD
jgi:hypothetical protein